MSEDRHLKMLVEGVRLLAAELAVQIDAFPAYVHIPDEVALTFDEVYRLAGSLESEGLISGAQKAVLDGIDGLLAEMSEDSSLWTLDALRAAEKWAEARASARVLLDALGTKEAAPRLFWVQYVPAAGEATMTHHARRVDEYHALRPGEFPDLDSMELCQLVPPEVQTAELVVSLRLRPRARGDSRRLCLQFWGVRNLKVRQTLSVITMFLEVSCIAERQWEGVHYKVQDTEHGSISFYCRDFEGRIEER